MVHFSLDLAFKLAKNGMFADMNLSPNDTLTDGDGDAVADDMHRHTC